MAEETLLQLQIVQTELHQVQDQKRALVELEKSLLDQQDELLAQLDFHRQESVDEENGPKGGVSRDTHTDWSGSFEWDDRAADLCMNTFGISAYRTNQREIINAVMSGRDVVVIMAAGGGKSLCYQLPSLLRHGISLVVSPLLSLIQDQVMGLTALGIPAGMLTSITSKEEEKSIYAALEKGGDLRVLYVTPEKIAKSKRFMSKLEKCNKAERLSLMAIDEAHCCSQWGHDFRPDYKNLGILKTQFPKVPIIALTATATQRVQTDVREMLHITYCEKFVSSINRRNLFYEIRQKQTNASGVIDDIAEFIKLEYTKKESGIVYCFSRRECEQVADELRKRKISAAHYHAYMEPEEKSRVHTRWSSNKIQVIVGTVAFGMGINKPDVRFVVHHSISKSLETYYQESGRAGRDGLPAHCLLFFRPTDLSRQSSMVFAEYAGLPNLYAMARFCQSKKTCRRAAFFRHFGEQEQACNGMCDNCAYSKDVVDQDVTPHAKSLVTHLKESSRSEQKLTVLQLVDSWKSRSRQSGPEDSALRKELSKEDVERVIIQLLLDGILKEEFQHTAYATNAYITLGAKSTRFIEGKSQQKVVLEVVQGVKAKAKNQPGGTGAPESVLQSGMAQMLDSLRQQLAVSHGIIGPHSVLSSQHMTTLSALRPDSLDQVEKVIGKRKTQQFGPAILQAIRDYINQNPQENFEKTGPSVSPKLASSISLSKAQSPNPGAKQTRIVKVAPVEKISEQPSGTHPRTPVMAPEGCIDLDTESEREEEPQKGPKIEDRAQGRQPREHSSDNDEDEDFVLIKRQVKRKR